ncbi:MAG: PfkB family carbohydrate kinase [Acetobacteraceae bacterium]
MSISRGDEFLGALTSSPIEQIDIFNDGKLAVAIANAEMVVADTNLTAQQIKIIHNECLEVGIPFALVSASDAKAERLLSGSENGRFTLVGMNKREFDKIASKNVHVDDNICQELRSERVLVSMGSGGATLYDLGGQVFIPAPNIVTDIINTNGAGDALFSAVCSSLLRKKPPSSPDEQERIKHCIAQVLTKHGNNRGRLKSD